jgi:hypothetical protein
VETLKAAGAERRAVTHWTNLFVAEMNVSLRRGRLSALVETAIHGLALLSPVALLLVGAHLVVIGQLSLGAMLALASLGGAFLEPLSILVGTALQVQLLGSYLARIEDVIDTPTETDGRDLQHPPQLTGAVRAEALTFRYHPNGPPAVDSADLDVRPGQVLAIVGRSGSGKSTLGRLLLGLYSPSDGRVLLDGIDLATLYPRSVRSQIGVVTQDPYIFGLFANFLVLISAVYAGIADRALELGVTAVSSRQSLKTGKPYSQDPDIRYQLADAAILVDSLGPQLERLAADVDGLVDHGADWFRYLTGLKTRVVDASRSVVETSLRVSGGRSFSADSEISRLYRDALAGLFQPSDPESAHATIANNLVGPLA